MAALNSFLSSFLGYYSATSYEYPVLTDMGYVITYVIPSGLAGVDFAYLTRAALLLILVYCTFKLLGGIVCRIF